MGTVLWIDGTEHAFSGRAARHSDVERVRRRSRGVLLPLLPFTFHKYPNSHISHPLTHPHPPHAGQQDGARPKQGRMALAQAPGGPHCALINIILACLRPASSHRLSPFAPRLLALRQQQHRQRFVVLGRAADLLAICALVFFFFWRREAPHASSTLDPARLKRGPRSVGSRPLGTTTMASRHQLPNNSLEKKTATACLPHATPAELRHGIPPRRKWGGVGGERITLVQNQARLGPGMGTYLGGDASSAHPSRDYGGFVFFSYAGVE